MRDSVPSTRYSSVCNVLRLWNISLIPTYRVYRLYDKRVCECAHLIHVHARAHVMYLHIINPRRACARVIVLGLSIDNRFYNLWSVCLCMCVFSLFWHLEQSGVQTVVSATSARYGHKI